MNVRIRGDGVAARCCAHLLAGAGIRVSIEATKRARVPAIMLGDAAQQLIRDIFEQDQLFRDLPGILKRVVVWGPDSAPVELEHRAVVVSEESLLGSLGAAPGEQIEADWTIYSAAPLPAAAKEHRFGSRIASAVAVTLEEGTPNDACWVESVEDGWLFLTSGWLITVGDRPLEKSTLVRRRIAACSSASVSFPASPRIVTPPGGPGWVACGSAAIGFDPLCGDGTANGVREAILASAVIRAIARGEEPEPLLAHYEARLSAGFERHLAESRRYYLSGGAGLWWRSQAEAAGEGLEWCSRKLAGHGPFRYRLAGLDLAPL